jgi:hypothetical protein
MVSNELRYNYNAFHTRKQNVFLHLYINGNNDEVVPKINVPVKSINKVSYVPITNAQQNWSPNLS